MSLGRVAVWLVGAACLLALALCGVVGSHAQGCGPQNPNCIVPTAPAGTCTNQAASTQFVCNNAGGGGGFSAQRSVTAAPVVIQPSDQVLNLNLTATSVIQLPGYASRAGVPLLFKDVGNQATANPQTIQTLGGEQIDDAYSSVQLGTNGQAIRLVPANDGVNTGWFRE